MTNPPRPDGSPDPTKAFVYDYPPYPDPAYADSPYGSGYNPPTQATTPLPPYWTQTTGQPPPHQPQDFPPLDEPPGSPKWLWVAAGFALLLVIGLVVALVIVGTSSQEEKAVAPMPSFTEPSTTRTPSTTTRTTPRTTPRVPPTTPPTTSRTPPTPTGPTETVVYEVQGTGRALSIVYLDTGNVLQTEFNVSLPWTKEVALPEPAKDSASVTVVSMNREATCSISIEGQLVKEAAGTGLTFCFAGA